MAKSVAVDRVRCPWSNKDAIYQRYHDNVWGVPEHNDKKLFAKLCLDGAQAGLSWYTILIRTDSYKRAFDNWDAEKIARYDRRKVERLLNDPGIIRNRQKVESVIKNARAYLAIRERESFNDFLWKHVDHETLVNRWKSTSQIPAKTPLSDRVSKDLSTHGFSFVGSTIVYAFMQAVGMVDDHLLSCFRRKR